MTNSPALLVYLIFMMAILVVASHLTKNRSQGSEESDENAEPETTPFVETTETVEFSENLESVDKPALVLLPSGHSRKLYLCRFGITAPPGVDVYVAEGLTLMVEPIQTIQEPPRDMAYDCESRIQFPDGTVHHVTRCYGGSTDELSIEVYAGAGITLIVKNRKLVNY